MQVDNSPLCEPPLSRLRTIVEIATLLIFAGLIIVFVEYGIPFLAQ
jgi:hypothetical protein